MKTLLISSALALFANGALAEPGFQPVEIDAPHHGRAIEGAFWYPATGGSLEIYADNPVFQGFEVRKGGEIASGTYPLVLMSHGMGGGIRPMAWLAAGLAERGAIVVNVSHPGTTWADFDMDRGMAHWTRAQDLSAALDATMEAFPGQVDASRIMALGFSYGGWTALSLGGLRSDHAGFVETCQSGRFVECESFLASGVAEVTPEVWNADYSDPRVTHVFALDPGLVWGLERTDGLIDNVHLVGLGAGEDRLAAADFDASGLADLLPDARTTQIAPATHFTALPICKPAGAEILEAENDDPVCTDPDGADRAAIHARIIDLAAADLGL